MIWFKRGLAIVALAIVLYLFWPLLGELRQAAGLFQQARWNWLALALMIQMFSYACLTALNYLLLLPFEGKIGFWRLMATLTAMAFIEIAIPSAGASGVILRAHLLEYGGYAVETSTFTFLLEAIYLGLMMGLASLSGLSYLLRGGELSRLQDILGGSVVLVALTLGGLIFGITRDRARMKRGVSWLIDRWNWLVTRFGRPAYPPVEAMIRLDKFYDGLAYMNRRSRWPYLLMAGGRISLDIASLGVCFIAFGYPITPGILLTGYGLMMLLSGLAALPGGLGLADVSMAVVYARLGVPGAVAVAVTLIYRLMAFWLVRFLGFVNWQLLEMNRDPVEKMKI
jgi:uncharacterized protein (TIRG00374 family)